LVKKVQIFGTVCTQKSTTMDHNTKCDIALFTLQVTNKGHAETVEQLQQQHSCTHKVKLQKKRERQTLVKHI
jgi:hypothetical protein